MPTKNTLQKQGLTTRKSSQIFIAAMDMPYPQAYAKITKLCERPAQDAKKIPHATLTAVFSAGTN